MLGDFEHQAVAVVVGLERVEDRRQMVVEGDVDDGADDLPHLAGRAGRLDRGGDRLLPPAAFFAGALAGASAALAAAGAFFGVAAFAILLPFSSVFFSAFAAEASCSGRRPRAPRRPK